MSRVLITGITGQDGSYLADQLLAEGCEVHGTILASHPLPNAEIGRIRGIVDRITLHQVEVEDRLSMERVVRDVQPDECYHLAAISRVSDALSDEDAIWATNVEGTRNVLHALLRYAPTCRLVFASSAEVFGDPPSSPQNENTPIRPVSLYGISKAAGQHLVDFYRRRRDLFAASAILYNHESERRGHDFLPRKVSLGVARIKAGLADELVLGDLTARRDWGYAPDYMQALTKIMRAPEPRDWVVATGITHSVEDLVRIAFDAADLDWRQYVRTDENLLRPAQKMERRGDATRLREELGWRPSISFLEMIRRMVAHDIRIVTGSQP